MTPEGVYMCKHHDPTAPVCSGTAFTYGRRCKRKGDWQAPNNLLWYCYDHAGQAGSQTVEPAEQAGGSSKAITMLLRLLKKRNSLQAELRAVEADIAELGDVGAEELSDLLNARANISSSSV